jgi:hypothetical protein
MKFLFLSHSPISKHTHTLSLSLSLAVKDNDPSMKEIYGEGMG